MSSLLKPLDLTSAPVGATGSIDFNQFIKFAPNNMSLKAHIGLYNESGCGLNVVFQASGNAHYLPAGGWGTFALEPNDGSVSIIVTYTLPNPPVSALNAVYYAPGERVPDSFTLGNSPIGIGGTVNTSSVQTLSNEGNAANTLVIDIGDAALTQLIKFYTDHFILKVDQSGTAHNILAGQISGSPALIGQTGDTSEVQGSLLVDQNETVTGTSTIGTLITNSAEDTLGNLWASITAGSVTRIGTPTGGTVALQVNGVNIFSVVTGGGNVNGTLGVSGAVTLSSTLGIGGGWQLTGGDGDFNGHKALNVLQLKFNNGNLISGINCGTFVAGALTGTQNHGLVGTPSVVMIGGADTTGTTTSSAFSYTSTQFSWRVNNSGQTMAWLAMKF